MAKKRSPAKSPDHEELIATVDDLREQVRVLREAVDELRSDLQWIANNAEPAEEWRPNVLRVRQMAADPCARDWTKRLEIDRPVATEQTSPATPAAATECAESAPMATEAHRASAVSSKRRTQSELF